MDLLEEEGEELDDETHWEASCESRDGTLLEPVYLLGMSG